VRFSCIPIYSEKKQLIKDRGFTTKEGNEACKTKVIGATTTQLKTFLLWQKLFDKMQK